MLATHHYPWMGLPARDGWPCINVWMVPRVKGITNNFRPYGGRRTLCALANHR